MPTPDVDVVTHALRAEARTWDEQCDRMGSIFRTVDALRLNRVEAGLFQIVFSAYENAIHQISGRCREGQQCMADIADALIKNASAYDNGEADVTHTIEGAY
ncbi:hypothetical protein AB0C51_13135 [Streptomyces pathocidini]|uniref:hypothetical protein n=1 Tax=Streptomyces pathocidini TaxID=1650571 RepID=UPI003406E8EA